MGDPRSQCPNCGEKVSAFAAGCAVCGADLDPRRFDRPPPRRWGRIPAGRLNIPPGAKVLLVLLAIVAVFGALEQVNANAPYEPPDYPVAQPTPKATPAPPDVARVNRVFDTGTPDQQRAALTSYLRGRHVSAAAISATLAHTQTGIDLRDTHDKVATRIGGRAVVPAGQGWPRDRGTAMTPIALIDFAELPPLPGFPRTGRLALYYALGDKFDDFRNPRAYYFPPGAKTNTPGAPRGVTGRPVYKHGVLRAFAGEQSAVVEHLPDREQNTLIDAMNALENPVRSHIGGASLDIQGPPLEGIPYEFKHTDAATRARYSTAEQTDPSQWMLLAQAEEEGDLVYADAGVIYYLIPKRDLAARRFDRVVGVLDSH